MGNVNYIYVKGIGTWTINNNLSKNEIVDCKKDTNSNE